MTDLNASVTDLSASEASYDASANKQPGEEQLNAAAA